MAAEYGTPPEGERREHQRVAYRQDLSKLEEYLEALQSRVDSYATARSEQVSPTELSLRE